jgi:exonuclease III
MSKICLVILYNHRFEKNIDKLNRLYSQRFTNIIHIVPFFESADKNVHTVYEASYFFQNHINQAFRNFDYQQFDHYVFVGDDLILHPEIDENNILERLNLGNDSGYIKELKPLHKVHHLWLDKYNITTAFNNPGFDYLSQLPPLAEQLVRLKNYNIEFKKQSLRNLIDSQARFSILQIARYKNVGTTVTRLLRGYKPPIPLVTSYSDFFVVPKSSMKSFVHLCGVYGALNLWVEAAIPTALALSCENIVTEGERSAWKGTEIWGKKNKTEFESKVKTSSELNNKFETFQLYIHPVKLSRLNLQ